jgi:hypothetical protein
VQTGSRSWSWFVDAILCRNRKHHAESVARSFGIGGRATISMPTFFYLCAGSALIIRASARLRARLHRDEYIRLGFSRTGLGCKGGVPVGKRIGHLHVDLE